MEDNQLINHTTEVPASHSLPKTLNDLVEKQHFCRIISAFKSYRKHSLERIHRNEQYLNSLPSRHQELLEDYRKNLQEFKKCVKVNQRLLNQIIKHVSCMFENVQPVSDEMVNENEQSPELSDIDKVQTTLKQFVRDWCIQGLPERQACYDPIIDEIVYNFPPDKFNPIEVKVLVPGAGLGRLAFEIVKRGYSCEGNEFSLFMLFASNFVLNKCPGTNLYSIHPWIHQFDNNMSAQNQLECVSFPDVNPLNLGHTGPQFTMIAGDFLEVYKIADQWDCVATCFFIDCAANVVAFVESIYHILKPGGIWINFGPLLYHFTNFMKPESVEISYEDLKKVVTGFGFIFEKENIRVKTKYAQNPKSMLQYGYESVFFVCRKPTVLQPYSGDVLEEGCSRMSEKENYTNITKENEESKDNSRASEKENDINNSQESVENKEEINPSKQSDNISDDICSAISVFLQED